MGKVKFQGFDCEIQQTTYGNGRTALLLVDAKDPEHHVAVATVNLPDVPLPSNQVFIKDYSENQGMLDGLEKAGIVKATGAMVETGFVRVPVAEVLTKPGDYERTLEAYARADAGKGKEPAGIER